MCIDINDAVYYLFAFNAILKTLFVHWEGRGKISFFLFNYTYLIGVSTSLDCKSNVQKNLILQINFNMFPKIDNCCLDCS